MPSLGCIGCGHMGSAILKGFVSSPKTGGWTLRGFNRNPEKLLPLRDMGVQAAKSIEDLAANSDIVVFAVKPYQMDMVMRQAAPAMRPEAVAISLAAGFSLAAMRRALNGKGRICRCMPTTTALVGKGVFAFSFEGGEGRDMGPEILNLFSALGYCLEMPEDKITAFSALIGAGPAYVFSMMQALVQAGISIGFDSGQSARMVCELFAGCAEMAAGQTKHLMELREDVCSPGGLTIAGVNEFDRAGLTGIIVDAVLAALQRGREMDAGG